MILPYADEHAFEYVECIYAFCVSNHEGQFSKKYEILCKTTFRPGACWKSQECEATVFYQEVASLTDDQLSQALDECLAILEQERD